MDMSKRVKCDIENLFLITESDFIGGFIISLTADSKELNIYIGCNEDNSFEVKILKKEKRKKVTFNDNDLCSLIKSSKKEPSYFSFMFNNLMEVRRFIVHLKCNYKKFVYA